MSRKDKDFEWKNRVLCSDESCIGVIGPDGRCKECGLVFEGELPDTFHQTSGGASSQAHARSDNDSAMVTAPPDDATNGDTGDGDDSDDEWEHRTLCIDESCIGVIGPDGRCKECGKPHTGND